VFGRVNSELDEVLVSYLEESKSSGRQICYFGYAYYFADQALLSAVPIQNTEGDIVTPTYETIGDGSYNPLARRICMNLLDDAEALDDTIPFIKFGLDNEGLVSTTGSVA
jgi:phosphate transport system substrate-binding protein